MGTPELVVVGGGKMGEALVSGLISSGTKVAVVEKIAARRDELAGRYPELTVEESAVNLEAPAAVIAVKPADVAGACEELSGVPRVLSIAAGVTLADLERWLPGAAVVRAMPNTPALVGAGASAFSGGSQAGPDDLAWARRILEAVGLAVELPEKSLDAVTGLSGSGPAYLFLLAEALVDAGVLVGLSRDVARQLTVQTLLGSARLMAETGEEPSSLRAAVTSPGGTTAAGLRALELGGLRSTVLEAVAAATARSEALGQMH